MLDCGTGTCSQINRFYGDEAPEIYRRLKAVFVSHMHLDHHIGLPELFRWRKSCLPTDREPLRIFCPMEDLKSWLLFYAKNVEPIHADMRFIDNDILVRCSLIRFFDDFPTSNENLSNFTILLQLDDKLAHYERLYLNVKSLITCPVDHFRKSYALSMTFPYQKEGKRELFKLAYSGDTGLSKEFVQIGQNADLLIHEATFQSELEGTALKYHHSTSAMAIEQAENMQAKHTILTHFSARYHALPYIRNELKDNMGIAFDYMEVTPSDFPRLNSLYAQYREAFPNVENSLEQKTRKYLLRLEETANGPMPFE